MTTKSTVEDELKVSMAAILQQLQNLKAEASVKASEESSSGDKKGGKLFEKKMDNFNGKFKIDVRSPSRMSSGAQTNIIQEDPVSEIMSENE